MAQLRSTLINLSPRGRLTLIGSVLGVLIVGFLLLQLASRPSYSTLMTGLNPADTGKLTAALDEQGLGYKLENNGTALAVDSAKTAEARVALAEQGLADRGQPGFEIFDKQKLGTSDFQQRVNYQRALEGEISRTIGQVDGVSGAKVQLVLPDEQLFAEEESPATAAVLLSGNATALEPSSVKGIAQLVSSSVKGLRSEKVSITDETGRLLWPSGDGAAGGAGSGSKQAAEVRYGQQVEGTINAMLARTVGADKAQVKVTPRLNVDEATEEKLTYDGKGVALKEKKESETLAGGGTGGTAGTRANIPGYAASAAGGGGDYERTTTDRDLGVNKTVTRRKIAPGQVEKLDVALVVDKSVPAAEIKQLSAAVASAAGVDTTRGDTISTSTMTFAKAAEPKAANPMTPFMGAAKYAGLGLATLLFLFFVRRHLRRRESDALGAEPTWLRELTGSTPVNALDGGPQEARTRIQGPPVSQTRQQLEEIVDREPERVAAQVRTWMRDE